MRFPFNKKNCATCKKIASQLYCVDMVTSSKTPKSEKN